MNDEAKTDQAAASAAIQTAVQRLQQLSQRSLQAAWHWTHEPLPKTTVTVPDEWQHWPIATPNARDHIAWARGQKPLWLCQQIVVPETLNSFPLEGLTLQRLTLLKN